MKIGIFGGNGRMGRAIAELAPAMGADIAGECDVGGDRDPVAKSADVIIDFSSPAALADNLAAALRANKPMVIGTTGLDADHQLMIDEAVMRIAILQSANMSLGVNLLASLVQQACARLGDDWDVEILEMHHRHKVDAPSGTALLLGHAASSGRGITPPPVQDLNRQGLRERGSIGFASLRGGSVAGDHLVVLAADGERIELGHRAESRDVFARGAITAARWLSTQTPGRYSMADVLSL